MRTFQLQVVTPEGILFDGEAESVLVHTLEGDVEILAGHTDLFAPLGVGRARILAGGEKKSAACSGGFLSVLKGKVKLAAVTFEFADTLDITRANAAKERAERAIAAARDDREQRIASAKLARALARISVYENR